jgi:hypothetical protein
MADREEVPSNPLVLVEIDGKGRLIINGYDVPTDGTVDPRQLAVAVVCSDFARPLGRPVRALVDQPHGETTLVVHPDGRVTDVVAPMAVATQAPSPATPQGVPPAMRAQGWLAAREADRVVAAEIYAARHAGRRRRYPAAVAGGALVVLGVGLVVFWANNNPEPDPAGQAAPRPASDVADELPPEQPIVRSDALRPVAVSGVNVETEPELIRLEIAAQRRTTAMVVVTPLDGSASPQGQTLTIHGAGARLVSVADLAPGRYEWQVVVPGQPSQTGVVRVPAVPPPVEVVVVPIISTPEQPDTEEPEAPPANEQPADLPQPTGVHNGPNAPVDPDGD